MANGCSVERQKAACQVRPPFGAVGMLFLPDWRPLVDCSSSCPDVKVLYPMRHLNLPLACHLFSSSAEDTQLNPLPSFAPSNLPVPSPESFLRSSQNRQNPTSQGLFKGYLAIRLTVHRKPFIRPPRLPQHRSPLDAPGSFIWKTKTHQQQGGVQQCDPGRTVSPTSPCV